MKRFRILRSAMAWWVLAGAVAFSVPAAAGGFRSIADHGVILYDAPSVKAGKLYVASRYLPVEVVVSIEGWAKVRDSSGDLAWVEKKALAETRFVIVVAPLADVRLAPDANAPLVFQAQRQVVLELLEPVNAGWIRVQHRDGQSGFVKSAQVWGL